MAMPDECTLRGKRNSKTSTDMQNEVLRIDHRPRVEARSSCLHAVLAAGFVDMAPRICRHETIVAASNIRSGHGSGAIPHATPLVRLW